jgi:hypothetical protein
MAGRQNAAIPSKRFKISPIPKMKSFGTRLWFGKQYENGFAKTSLCTPAAKVPRKKLMRKNPGKLPDGP